MNWPNAARCADEKAPGRGFSENLDGLDVKVAGGVDGVIKFVEVAVGALGKRLLAATGAGFVAGSTSIKLDNIGDIGEFAIGLEVVVFGGFG